MESHEEEIKAKDLARMIEEFGKENQGCPCILCGGPMSIVGVYIPIGRLSDPYVHLTVYPVCNGCVINRPDDLAERAREVSTRVLSEEFDPNMN